MNSPELTRLYNLLIGSMKTQAIYVAVELGIPDLLASKSYTLEELAESVEANPDFLRRLLRALSSIGIFRENLGVYEITNMGELLCSQYAGGLRSYILLLGQPLWWQAWGNLMSAVKEGGSAFELTHGQDFFTHLVQDEKTRSLFHDFMRNISIMNADAIVSRFPFHQYSTIVDVGGGQGELLCSILRANPKVKGVLFDRPEVLTKIKFSDKKIAERIEVISGDFFKAIPTSGDLYIMQQIMHDWDDEDAVSILKSCKHSMVNADTLLILDAVINLGNQPDLNKFTDLHMMVLGNGAKERSEEEFAALLSNAGLNLDKVIATGTAFSIILAKKVIERN